MSGSGGKPRILVTFGTRPEAIKMFPVIFALRETGRFDVRVVVTAQHRELLDSVLALAELVFRLGRRVVRRGRRGSSTRAWRRRPTNIDR